MYEFIYENTRTIEGLNNLLSQDKYYAYKWAEEGNLEVSDEVFSELCLFMCMNF